MKLYSSVVRNSLFAFVTTLALFGLCERRAWAQEKPEATESTTSSAKFSAAKAQSLATSSAEVNADSDKEKGKADKDGPDAIRKRDQWFYQQRSSANGHIPAGARLNALQHMLHRMEAEGKLVHRPDGTTVEVIPQAASVTNTWTSIGPTPTTGGNFSPVTGRITTIAIDPSDATGNTALIGGAQGGIWRTTDAGTTWTAVGDQGTSLSMGSIAFAPSNPTTVYAGTGEQASIGFDVYYGAGVLKSTNGGLTWTPTCTTPSTTCPFIGPFSNATPFGFFTFGGARISYIAVNPANAQMVLAAAQYSTEGAIEGVYCTDNGGTTWSQVLSGEMSSFVGFASATTAYAALGNPFGSTNTNPGNGIFKATSIGATCPTITFSRLTAATLPAQSSMGRIDLGISPNFATDNTIYASIANAGTQSSSNLGVWVTSDGGTTWTQTAASDVCTAQCWYDNVVKVDPSSKNFAFMGGAAVSDASGNFLWVSRTINGGTSWAGVLPNVLGPGLPHVDQHAMAFFKLASGKVRMYLGNDGGIWRTDDAENAAVTWTNLNDSTLTLSQFYPALSIHPSSQAIAFAGTQDNGSQAYAGPSVNWTDNGQCGDGTGTAIDNIVPSTVYVACNGLNLFVSTQNGQPNTFVPAVNGISTTDNSSFVPPVATDPSTASVLYAGTTKVYQSVNAGSSWAALSSDLVSGTNNLTAITVAPKNSKVVYAGANTGQVFVATNVAAGSGAFAAVTGQGSLPPRQVSAVAIDPADATGNTAYVAVSGFAFVANGINDPKGHLFKTTDGGATWTDVSCTVANCSTPAASDLPNTPVNDVVVDPNIAGTLYVGTDIGVYQGACTPTPTTCTWSTLSTGLPRVAVLSLKLHSASRTLRAATHGRGVWDIVLNNFTFPGPHISSISPVSALAGGAGFSLTVNGNGLTSGAVQWNGTTSNVTTQQVSDSQLTATIAASLIGGAGAPPITVSVGANTSNALTFTVLGGAPTITSVSPTSAMVHAAATPLTIVGTGFNSSTKVVMNPDVGGTLLITPSSVTATQLTATLPASFMANFGSTNSVGVQNPPPGGGTTVTTSTVSLPTFVVIAPPPANDNFANAINITSTSFTDTKDSSGATTETADPIPACVSDRTNTIWYKVVPTSTGLANIDTLGSSYDTVLSVWSGTSQAALTPVACNDDISPSVIQSQLTNVTLTAGTTYYIMVSAFGSPDPNPLAFGGMSVLNFAFSGGGAGNFTVSGTAATVTAGSSGTSTITVTPSGGFTGMVTLSCPAAASLPPGVTCPNSPLTITVPTGGANGTGSLNLAVAAPAAQNASASLLPAERTVYTAGMTPNRAGKGWWVLSGGTGLAAVLLVLFPGRKRYRAALGLGLISVVSSTLGCGGGYSSGGGGGPVATTTKITVTSVTKAAAGATFTFTATVTGGTPTDSVQLLDGGVPTGTAVAVANGMATLTTAALNVVGTHTITAHYAGDAMYTQASSSGPLNVTVTGSTTVGITTNPTATPAAPALNLTIN